MPIRSFFLAGLMCSALTACLGDAGDVMGVTDPKIRFANMLAEGPAVTLSHNGTPMFEDAGEYRFVGKFESSSDDVHVFTAENAQTRQMFDKTSFKAGDGHRYTVALIAGTEQPALMVIDDAFKGLAGDRARLRGVNAVPGDKRFDIYVVPPASTDIASVVPVLGGVSYKSSVPASGQDASYMAGGRYEILLTAAGSKEVLYRSAVTDLQAADVMLFVVPDAGTNLLPDTPRYKVMIAHTDRQNRKAL